MVGFPNAVQLFQQLALRGGRRRKHHAQRNQKQNDTATNLQRQLAQVHHPQKAFADKHEGEQQRKRNQYFAQDHARPALGGHVFERIGKNGNVANGVGNQHQQNGGGPKRVVHHGGCFANRWPWVRQGSTLHPNNTDRQCDLRKWRPECVLRCLCPRQTVCYCINSCLRTPDGRKRRI
jgi:hypothetical protein